MVRPLVQHGLLQQPSAQVIDGSLTFDSSKKQHLIKTFTSSGSASKFTWSYWVKKTKLGVTQRTFSSATGTGNPGFINWFNSSDKLEARNYNGLQWDVIFTTSQVFRDLGWYHIVCVVDVTQSTSTDRIKLYLNGERITEFDTTTYSKSQYVPLDFNGTASGAVGARGDGQTNFINAQMTNFYAIDGQALGPEYFGFTDPLTNTWRPKKYINTTASGGDAAGVVGFGTNGFYLPMDGNSPPGEDKSGQGNNWEPASFGGSNSIEKATGALPILNTDGGGNVARIGVRTDATVVEGIAAGVGTCVLAVPLVGNTDDVSNKIDSRSTTKTATSSGLQASTTQSNFYNGSHYWNANSDSLSYAEQGDELVFGTGDFTIECWVYDDNSHDGTGNRCYIFDNRVGGSVVGDPPQVVAYVDTHSEWNVYIGNPVVEIVVEVGTHAIIDRWNHFAVTREGSTVRMFVNGVQLGSATSSTNFTNNGIGVGRASDSGYGWAGYIQDFRVYKGVAKYTKNFIPASTSPDILPDTPSGVSGGPKLTKITEGAVVFGTDGYMTTTSSDYNPGTGDFAIEGYFRFPDNSGTRRAFINDTGTFGSNSLVIRQYNTGFEFYCGGQSFSDSGYNMAQWNHAMITRSGTTIRYFVNGELRATDTSSNSISAQPTNQMTIGGFYDVATPTEFMRGHASNLRLTVGSIPTDYQTSSTTVGTIVFTPSSEPLTSTSQGATSSDVKLLCCQSPTSATAAAVASASLSTNNTVQGSTFNPFNTDINTVRGQETGYATLNPLINGVANSLSDGNLTSLETTGDHGRARSTLTMDTSGTGKFYFEARLIVAGGSYPHIGVIDSKRNSDGTFVGDTTNCFSYFTTGGKQLEGTSSTYGDSFTIGDTIGCSLDCGSGQLRFYKNGIDQGVAKTITADFHACFAVSSYSNGKWEVNFGQKPFKFPPPDGFQPLNGTNVPNVRPETVIVRPDQYVGISTYDGENNTRNIQTGFAPDLVFFKSINSSKDWAWYDSVRGATNRLRTPRDTEGTQATDSSGLTSFNSNGFTMGNSTFNNGSSKAYASYSFKAGGNSGTFNVDGIAYASAADAGLTGGTITPSGASVGTEQGFSIIEWEGTNNNKNISHGLSQTPEFIINKNIDTNTAWYVGSPYLSTSNWGKYLVLDGTARDAGNSDVWSQGGTPNATTFGVGSVGNSTGTHIAYLWHSVRGLQKFGQFAGNGDADGVFVELGFKPAMLLIKNYDSTGDWIIWDSVRNPSNPVDRQLWPYTNSGTYGAYDQVGSSYPLDFLSNGFKMRTTDADMNSNSRNYLYAAWADVPTFNLYGGQSTGR